MLTAWELSKTQTIACTGYLIVNLDSDKKCPNALHVQPYKTSSIVNRAQESTKDVRTLHLIA
jgi:hypothetical protein